MFQVYNGITIGEGYEAGASEFDNLPEAMEEAKSKGNACIVLKQNPDNWTFTILYVLVAGKMVNTLTGEVSKIS